MAGEPLAIQGAGVGAVPNYTPRWDGIGPAPINNGQTIGNMAVTGRVTGVAVDPTDPNTIYISTAGGGAWKTKNSGLSWQPMIDNAVDAATGLPINVQSLFTGAIAISRFLARFPGYAVSGRPVRGGRVRFRGFLSVPCSIG